MSGMFPSELAMVLERLGVRSGWVRDTLPPWPSTVGHSKPNIFALPKVSVSVVGIPIEKQQKTRFATDDSMLGSGVPGP